ncbi:ferric reductase like transmembrane component-domain-containing protein [Leucosporidium creatinivorum]|uniref:Ferric reductase like transmembrane component-domain-containing protein n=1 Tax=Leucosporidium creatinivorum TaxID=106004 RepID=A0A1Y2FWP8_9BASI|nr:ferric reductase like transmembrane component-domain-containing protein [Leucosporidium creatinivorum]
MRWPTTVEEVAALPAAYGAHEARLLQLLRFAGDDPARGPEIVASYVAHRYNGFYVPAIFNLWLWRAVGSAIVVSLACRFLVPSIDRVPRRLLRVYTSVERACTLTAFYGTSSSEPKRVLPSSNRFSSWSTYQVPLLIDGILLSIYLVASFYFTFFHYAFLQPNIFFPDAEDAFPIHQYIRYLADRTAILSFGSTPLVILLAARNSPLSWLTGASFARLQVWHRWVSRVTFGAVLVHATAYIILILEPPSRGFWGMFAKPYLQAGWVACIGGNVLCIASWRRLREISYEIFLVGHILGALAWIIGAYYHVGLLHGQRSHLFWIYIAIAFWSVERILRLFSLLINNTPLRYLALPFSTPFFKRSPSAISLEEAPLIPKSPSPRFAEAEGTIVGDGEFIRLRLRLARKWAASRGRPGSYIFISIPGAARVWESHPFSIAWPLEVPLPTSISSSSRSSFASTSSSIVHLGNEEPEDDVAGPESIELIVKKCGGFTRRLCDTVGRTGDLEGAGGRMRDLRIMIEGPYGTIHTFEKERWVLLAAGGSGIAATVSHLADLAKHALGNTLKTDRVLVAWSIRTVETVSILLPYLLRVQSLFREALPSSAPFIDLHIYLTRPIASSSLPKPASTPSSILAPLLDSAEPFLTLATHLGRPQLGQHIDELLNLGSSEGGRVAVSACGPLGLCDRAREGVRERLGGEGVTTERLIYREEGGTW